jgi:hypothetical protein
MLLNCSFPTKLVLLPHLSAWARINPQSRVLGKPEIPSELFHVHYLKVDANSFVQVWTRNQVHAAYMEKNEFRLVSKLPS